MNTIYQRLVNHIDSIIREEAKQTSEGYYLEFEELPELEQQEIVALFLEYDDRDMFSIYENEKSDDIVSSLLTMLKNGTREASEDFAECVRSNVVKYYSKRAQEMIDDRLGWVEQEDDWERGYVKRQDRNTGEYHLARI